MISGDFCIEVLSILLEVFGKAYWRHQNIFMWIVLSENVESKRSNNGDENA